MKVQYTRPHENTMKFVRELSLHLICAKNMVDLGDVGNEIGFLVGEYIKENNLQDCEFDFVSGIKHGLSLVNGKH